MTQIKIAAPMPVANAQRAGGAAADLALKLLQPMQGLLLAGESAEAEVVSVREQAQSFQVVLRLTLADGRQALLQASASRPVALGTAYGITACPTAASAAPSRRPAASRWTARKRRWSRSGSRPRASRSCCA